MKSSSTFSKTRVDAGRSIDDLPDGSQCLDRIGRTPAAEVVVFLDFDGTLSPIVDDPTSATLSEATRTAVARLARRCPVAVVSGRDLDDVRARVGLEHLIYSGSHGFDIAGPPGFPTFDQEVDRFFPQLDAAERQLRKSLETVDGCLIERKKHSLAIHTRRVSASGRATVETAVEQTAKSVPDLRKNTGRRLFEFQPRIDWDKGKAVLWLMKALNLDTRAALPIYLGDDVTDEDAFRILPPQGIGIVVKGGGHRTAADHSLRDTESVREFLIQLAIRLSPAESDV